MSPLKHSFWFSLLLAFLCLAGCAQESVTLPASITSPEAVQVDLPTNPVTSVAPVAEALPSPTPTVTVPPPTLMPIASPTPDPTRPGQEAAEYRLENHQVQYGDSLGGIAQQYNTSVEELMTVNGLTNPDAIVIGQILLIPGGELPLGPSDKLIPDSELVYGPAFSHFGVSAFAQRWGGYLMRYTEELEGQLLLGPEIVQLVAQRFSVGPRLLLALLELEAGWVTETNPAEDTLFYPMGKVEPGWDGLYIQLSWTATQLNRGFYGWDAGWLNTLELADGMQVRLAPGINAGTAAVQALMAHGRGFTLWKRQLGWDSSLMTIYRAFFGNPFAYAIEPLVPADLTQPPMSLPWRVGEMWYYTGGPHGGWGTHDGWAALDFVPPGDERGCYLSDAWVRAISPGRVIRSENGVVVVDMDDDGFEGTGWTVLYMHIGSHGRVPLGSWVAEGDKIGHPSCEGGVTNATHVHLARRYNGRWIEADGPIPFVMDGWRAISYWHEYDGALVKGNETREACECWEPDFNGILKEIED